MRVLFLGNSFTYFHALPVMAHHLTGWETDAVTRGGAYLHDFLNPGDEMYAQAEAALKNGRWDYVVLQEQSFNAIGNQADFLMSCKKLCEKIRAVGAVPVFYASWAYREGSEKLNKTGVSYGSMAKGLEDAYAKAARENEGRMANVGAAFTACREAYEVYEADDYHPSVYGSYLAACMICRAIEPAASLAPWTPEGMALSHGLALQNKAEGEYTC